MSVSLSCCHQTGHNGSTSSDTARCRRAEEGRQEEDGQTPASSFNAIFKEPRDTCARLQRLEEKVSRTRLLRRGQVVAEEIVCGVWGGPRDKVRAYYAAGR